MMSRGARMDADAEVGRRDRREPAGGHDERRDGQWLRVDAERDLGHRHVAAQHHLVDVLGLDAGLGAHLAREQVERLRGPGLEHLERVGIHHRRRDA